jgi:glycine C-acetyltransferase
LVRRVIIVSIVDNFVQSGLSCHPEVVKAGQAALEEFGSGVCSSRLIGGNVKLFKDLERKLAEFVGKEEAIIYTSGSAANMGVFQVLLSSQDVVLSDRLNHASLIDGMK